MRLLSAIQSTVIIIIIIIVIIVIIVITSTSNIKLALKMSFPQPTTQDASTKRPNIQDSQHKGTTPPDGVSGQYRNENLPQPMYLHAAVYVLSYEGCAWPVNERHDGISGVYTSLENAKQASTRWLREQPKHRHSDRWDTRIADWKVKGKGGDWKKEKAMVGLGCLESRVMRIKKCEVRMDSSLPDEGKGQGGTKDEVGRNDGEKGEKERKDGENDESAVEEIKRLTM